MSVLQEEQHKELKQKTEEIRQAEADLKKHGQGNLKQQMQQQTEQCKQSITETVQKLEIMHREQKNLQQRLDDIKSSNTRMQSEADSFNRN